ncbi:MAG TPA: alanine racemase, partial [Alphaproteobacteria bacterium]|nr:alanine racemase [Alphaproteobacteria bacterium]
IGICCATLREAEAMAAAGIGGLLLTTAVAPGKAPRLASLAASGAELSCVVDHPALAQAYAEAAAAVGTVLPVFLDLDVGLGRTGVTTPGDAVALAHTIEAAPALRLEGLQAYVGHLQHVDDWEERRRRLGEPVRRLEAMTAALAEAGIDPPVRSGGGTGTHRLDAAARWLNEIQAGSYVFMDVQYASVQQGPGSNAPPFRTALFVQTAVINVNHAGYAVTDAGLKSFATDGPAPLIAAGAPEGATYRYMGDEHGAVDFASTGDRLALGARIECVTPHCDPNVNLFDHYHVVRGDTLIDIWPVAARGNP